MGSSKKHKEKRDKKKHKRVRSRSRERDSHRRSSKSSRRERRSVERNSPVYESHASDERKIYTVIGDEAVHQQYFQTEKEDKFKSVHDVLPEEEFDIDEMLDSKLAENPEFSSRRISSKKRKRDDSSDDSRKRQVFGINEDSLEQFANEQLLEEHGIQPSKDASSDYLSHHEWPSHSKSEEIPFLNDVKVKEEPSEERNSEPEDYHDSQLSLSTAEMGKRQRKSQLKPPDVENEIPEPQEPQLSLSISETNKLRAKLGLKPLDVGGEIPGLSAEDGEKEIPKPSEVFVKTENIREKKKSEDLREKLKVIKDKRAIEEKLKKTKGIADSDSEDDSASAWVMKHKKLLDEKEQAEKRAKLLEEMDEEFGVGALVEQEFGKPKSYTSHNLKGLTVAHDVEAFQEGHQVILTLKDKGVLDEDDDVLENVNLVDSEKYAKNIENKKKKPDYRPYEEPEYDEFGILKKKNLLSKYDEEIEGEKKKTFKIGSVSNTPYVSREQELELIRMKLKQQNKMSLEMPELKIANEYYTPEDMVQFKKPKKKRKVRKPAILKAEDLIPDAVDDSWMDYGSRREKKHRDDEELDNVSSKATGIPLIDSDEPELNTELSNPVIDEEKSEKELYNALNKAKKLKQRKPPTTAPEKVLEMMNSMNGAGAAASKDTKVGNIELNSVAEFCRSLGEIPTYGMAGNRDEEADEMMDLERDLMEEKQRQELEAQNRGAWNEVEIDEKPAEISVRENEPILEEEPDISLGVAGALKLAMKKGYLDKDTKKGASLPRSSQLQAQSYTIEEKFYEDDKFGKRDRYTGPIQEFKEKNNYKPDVKLEYIDDNGRLLTAKEAFRYLSHKFHGKGPGKNKVDKRMKKVEQETRLKQMSSTDTPLNTVKLLQAKQKETQSPYIVLSGGNKTLTQTMISKTKPL